MEIKVEILSLDDSADDLFFAHHSAHVALSRFGSEITTVELLLEHVGNPVESVCRRCCGTAKGPRFGPVQVEATGRTNKQALHDVLRKCATGVGRALSRRKDGDSSP